ncbi:MAG: hypothetical protein ACLFNK_00850 [Candidatus Woesearchaeota archaeon]
MKEYDLQRLINSPSITDEKITELMDKELLFKQDVDEEEIKGHLLKADHNLRFVEFISKEPFQDWALTGCYYSCYHSALALIQTKGYTSKNHLATLCVIIKDFYEKELSKKDVEKLRIQFAMFVNKIKGILAESGY